MLGAYTPERDPRKEPVYSIGAIVKKGEGKNLPGGHIHAEYVDKMGHYDIVQYLEDRTKKFQQFTWFLLDRFALILSAQKMTVNHFLVKRAFLQTQGILTNVRLYEHLMIVKRSLGHIYCHIPAVKD